MQMTTINNQTKEKILLWSLLGVLIISSLLDMYTAISSGALHLAEINPIYLMTGNIWVLVAVNVLFIIYFIYEMRKKISLAKIYAFVIVILFLSFGHCFGAYTNIKTKAVYEQNPEIVKQYAEQVTKQEQSGTYFKLVMVIVLLPAMLSIAAFIISYKIFQWRKPKRDRIIEKIQILARELGE